jgi:hypothetical protein
MDGILDTMEENDGGVEYTDLGELVILETFEESIIESILLALDIWFEVGLEGVGDGTCEFRKGLQIAGPFILFLDLFIILLSDQCSDFILKFDRKV